MFYVYCINVDELVEIYKKAYRRFNIVSTIDSE